jgi:hypothetical protein
VTAPSVGDEMATSLQHKATLVSFVRQFRYEGGVMEYDRAEGASAATSFISDSGVTPCTFCGVGCKRMDSQR